MNQDRRLVLNGELRASQGEQMMIVDTRVVKYGALSLPGVPFPGARERFAAGTFTDSLRSGQNVTADYNHSTDFLPLGTTKNGTLEIFDTPESLNCRIHLDANVQAHRDIHRLVETGTLSECSLAFGEPEDSWSDEKEPDGRAYVLRTVKRAKLYGISLVMNPAYSDGATSAQARALRSLAYAGAAPQPRSSLTTAELRRVVEQLGRDIDLRRRAERAGREIEYQKDLDAVERSRKTGFIWRQTGSGPFAGFFDVMSDEEFDDYLLRKAEAAGKQIAADAFRENLRDTIKELKGNL